MWCAKLSPRSPIAAPLAAAELQNAGKAKGPWWGWSDGKLALEYLFWRGKVGVPARRGAFERVYDLPDAVHAAYRPGDADAH